MNSLDEQLKAIRAEAISAVFSDADLKQYLSELADLYMYLPVVDDRTCDVCMDNATLHPLVLGGDIGFLFPNARQIDFALWMILVHPHCRCMLVLQDFRVT